MKSRRGVSLIVRYMRTATRQGLIRARMYGANQAEGEYMRTATRQGLIRARMYGANQEEGEVSLIVRYIRTATRQGLIRAGCMGLIRQRRYMEDCNKTRTNQARMYGANQEEGRYMRTAQQDKGLIRTGCMGANCKQKEVSLIVRYMSCNKTRANQGRMYGANQSEGEIHEDCHKTRTNQGKDARANPGRRGSKSNCLDTWRTATRQGLIRARMYGANQEEGEVSLIVRYMRTATRQGLIRARMYGANQEEGKQGCMANQEEGEVSLIVRYMRTATRQGLIRARMYGANPGKKGKAIVIRTATKKEDVQG
ncbi:GALNT [Mytilus edulis]|uniref:GALNT n=1 Tax=Mytilus edulis TaxID=6550 RepID=A0A8S3VA63_MYTED|nr:GALNT [Mytilus edulis]